MLFATVVMFSISQTAHSSPAAAAASSKSDVRVVNTAAEPVPVVVQGTTPVTGSVAISNQPTINLASNEVVVANTQPIVVQPVREPFQQYVTASSPGGSEGYEAIVVPEGKRLTIESFSAQVASESPPIVYLRTRTAISFATTFRRSVRLDMKQNGTSNDYAGHTTTLLHSGSASEPSGATFSYDACFVGTGTPATMIGFVSRLARVATTICSLCGGGIAVCSQLWGRNQ